MIQHNYTIKIGIEEFPVQESDVPKIIEAMKTNDMVKLDFGIVRGQAILAILRRELFIESPSVPSREDIRKRLQTEAKDKCEHCDNGWIFPFVNGERIAKTCSCQNVEDKVDLEMKLLQAK